jgi:hypothetical protein
MLTSITRRLHSYTPAYVGWVTTLVTATHAAGASSLQFNITLGPDLAAMKVGTPTEQALAVNVIEGFTAATDIWRGFFHDPVTLNLTLEFGAVPPGVGGTAVPGFVEYSYADSLYPAMVADSVGPDDEIAVAHLPAPLSTGVPFVTNDTTVVPSPRILDDDGTLNNTSFIITRANSKALGLTPAHDTAPDGVITFNELVPFDFNPGDGIANLQIDFVMLAAHELGHAMGFFSGIENLDVAGGDGLNPESPIVDQHIDLDPYSIFTPLDLFRYTDDSLSRPNQPTGGINDGAFGQPSPNDRPFFSLDGGATQLATFSTGKFNGDGRQVSHWQDHLGLGILDPSLTFGESLILTHLDVQALDVIGWDLQPAPEPGMAVIFGAGSLLLLTSRRRAISSSLN